MASDNHITRMIAGFRNCFKIPELSERIIFTLLVLAVCRLIAWVPIPGLDGVELQGYFDDLRDKQEGGLGFMGMYSMFTGGAWERCSIGGLCDRCFRNRRAGTHSHTHAPIAPGRSLRREARERASVGRAATGGVGGRRGGRPARGGSEGGRDGPKNVFRAVGVF